MTQQQRILNILSDGEPHSTKEIADKTRIGYPPRRIHELRRRGYVIEGVKGKFWEEYRLLSSPSIQIEKESANKLSQSQSEQEQPSMFNLKNPL